tara:strand:+ start:4358 stop:5317 length:960 start_codon:yes stop_codon:yes gene_type:complete
MSNPWSDIYKEIRKPYLEGLDPVGKEDGDVNNDGKKDSSDSYLMKRRKAISKAMGKEDKKVKNEHHQKDADGNPIDHGDDTPSNVDEMITLTKGDYGSRNVPGSAYNTAKLKKFDPKIYKAGGGLGANFLPLVNSYEPAKVNKPNYSNWREDFVWDDNVDEAAKGKKLDVKENGVKNKIEINPDDGLKEEKKKLSEAKPLIPTVKTTKKDKRDMSKPDGTAKVDYRNLYMGEADVSEAKYERGASNYGKASIRNKRMFGKGGNARPPEERGAAITVRRARHQERRYVKKGNKYHEPGKYRPEVHGVNKPEEERKGKNIS